ncbi:hypothetical protein HDU78_001330 [Chytriomyces hyalinus]|nr:hypothetical protein HDU78_001330 [Chytriomyces hyalinus]
MLSSKLILLLLAATQVFTMPTLPIAARDSPSARCGKSWTDANGKCGTACPSGENSQCSNGETCFRDLATTPCANTPAPAPTNSGSTGGSTRCGSSWANANGKCGKSCPSGQNTECTNGETCFRDLAMTPCGSSPAPAPSSAPAPAPTGSGSTGGSIRCGSSWADANGKCGKSCPSGQSTECSNGETCFRDLATTSCGNTPAPSPVPTNTGSTGGSIRCGSSWADANGKCGKSCPSGQNTECSNGETCFRDLSTAGCSGTTPVPGPQPDPSGISSLVSESKLKSALQTCGISKSGLYEALVKGFTAPLASVQELALLLGNIAHESGAFVYVEEIACAGVTSPTALCPYGLYHGRGYIQLSWDYNYRAAASALNRPDIFSNPWVVQQDEATNWSTVQWYWTNSVQPALRANGYTLATSVRAINGQLECGGNPIAPKRIQFVHCFEQQLTGTQSAQTSC